MDVKRNGIPGSPRGNRANDIQALWYGQLMAGAKIAAILGEEDSAEQWSGIAQMLAANFENDFCNKEGNMVYDHLNSDGSADIQLRPNQLYCFDLINDNDFKQKVTRSVWEELVYPWGVASLAQWDPQFHPQHENWHYYHKDDAYHNGTIWLWNNGIAMQRMIEYGQVDTAWELFRNMNRQALVEGAVGSLSENADAHPREGKTWVNRSGTFLQAWSNAEHLRVWYQHFLGIRPDLLQGVIVVEPRIPSEIKSIETSVKVGDGTLHYSYKNGRVNVKLEGCDATLDIRKPAGHQTSPIFEGVKFCEPKPLENYPCFNTYYETALTY
jgi:glycogen debranching enzyme